MCFPYKLVLAFRHTFSESRHNLVYSNHPARARPCDWTWFYNLPTCVKEEQLDASQRWLTYTSFISTLIPPIKNKKTIVGSVYGWFFCTYVQLTCGVFVCTFFNSSSKEIHWVQKPTIHFHSLSPNVTLLFERQFDSTVSTTISYLSPYHFPPERRDIPEK